MYCFSLLKMTISFPSLNYLFKRILSQWPFLRGSYFNDVEGCRWSYKCRQSEEGCMNSTEECRIFGKVLNVLRELKEFTAPMVNQ